MMQRRVIKELNTAKSYTPTLLVLNKDFRNLTLILQNTTTTDTSKVIIKPESQQVDQRSKTETIKPSQRYPYICVKVKLRSDYPFKPPEFQFVSGVVYNPMVNPAGYICSCYNMSNWSPAITVMRYLMTVMNYIDYPDNDGMCCVYEAPKRVLKDEGRTQWEDKHAERVSRWFEEEWVVGDGGYVDG